MAGLPFPHDVIDRLPPITKALKIEQTDDDPKAGTEYIEQDDGSMLIVTREDGPDDNRASDFHDNLAEGYLPEDYLQQVSLALVEKIRHDKEARAERDKQQEDGLNRTGLGKNAPGGAGFQGASRTVHPGFIKACIDFASRTIKELYPPTGPVKMRIEGKASPDKMARAERKAAHMNWQLMHEIKEYRSELEQCLTQVPIGGSQYMKAWYDRSSCRVRVEFVPVDYVHLPYSASGFYAAERKTHELLLTEIEFNERIRNGMYRELPEMQRQPPSQEPELTESAKANEKIEGKKASGFNEDGTRSCFEAYVIMACEHDEMAEEGRAVPYIITIDDSTGDVLAWYRNWEEDDKKFEELDWIAEFPMIPWRGAYAIGFPHIIGSLSGAQTGAVRALLDSAHINNAPTLLKLKGASIGGQSTTVDPTGVTEIQGGLGVTDIRQIAMPMPFNPPSAVLYQLLGYLDEQMNSAVRTSMDNSQTDSSANVPVGTTLSRVEQGLMVFSSIFARLHTAQARFFRILHRLNRDHMPERVLFGDEVVAYRRDYESEEDVGPVSDPNVFSEMQRLAQLQAVDQIDALNPGIINKAKKVERQLKLLKLPDWEELLLKPADPEPTNPVMENMRMSLGQPAAAFAEQDHLAHLQVHLSFMGDPLLGSNPIIAMTFLPACLEHIKQHLVMWYVSRTVELVENHTGHRMGDLMGQDAEHQKAFDQMLAAASLHVEAMAKMELEKVPAVIQQASQLLQTLQPKPPADPAVQVAMAETQRRAQADKDKKDLQTADLQRKSQVDAGNLANKTGALKAEAEEHATPSAADLLRAQTQADIEAQKEQADSARNLEDNVTALHIAGIDAESGRDTSLSNGHGIDP